MQNRLASPIFKAFTGEKNPKSSDAVRLPLKTPSWIESEILPNCCRFFEWIFGISILSWTKFDRCPEQKRIDGRGIRDRRSWNRARGQNNRASNRILEAMLVGKRQ